MGKGPGFKVSGYGRGLGSSDLGIELRSVEGFRDLDLGFRAWEFGFRV